MVKAEGEARRALGKCHFHFGLAELIEILPESRFFMQNISKPSGEVCRCGNRPKYLEISFPFHDFLKKSLKFVNLMKSYCAEDVLSMVTSYPKFFQTGQIEFLTCFQ